MSSNWSPCNEGQKRVATGVDILMMESAVLLLLESDRSMSRSKNDESHRTPSSWEWSLDEPLRPRTQDKVWTTWS